MNKQDAAVFDLFGRALDEKPADLTAWLDANCDDPEQRRNVRVLLDNDRNASSDDSFLRSPVLRPQVDLQMTAPDRIGSFRILHEIGRGGMGTVYEAVQDRPSRTVALKLIRPEHSSAAVLKRFEHEAEVLGRLDHPGIAHIYEAGVTTDSDPSGWNGYPWFAMEFVRGERLDQWVERRKPSIQMRIGVLAEIADALHHAHQKGVIHRDIKPANIMVSEDGSPKLLDFGIARLVDEGLRPTGLDTGTGRLIGTLAYMSPEQVGGRSEQIDIRTDVYALGVVAYEMLTGRLPHATDDGSLPATARAIVEQSPERPSRIAPALRGDIETVVMAAMAKEPQRRYQSASEFASDLRRLLASQPVSARAPSAMYQLRCLARRNRALVGVTAAGLCALLVALAVVSILAYQLRATNDELDLRVRIAERETAQLRAVTGFLERTLTAPDPFADSATAPEIKVGDLLSRAETWLASSFVDAPMAEAAARAIVGRSQKGLGDFVEAERQIRIALDRLDTAGGEDIREQDTIRRAGLLAEHALVLSDLDRIEEALARLAESQEVAATLKNIPPRDNAARLGNLGSVLRYAGQAEEARLMMESAIAEAERAGSDADQNRAFTLANLAGLLTDTKEYEEAVKRYQQSLQLIEAIHGSDSPHLYSMRNNIGRLQLAMGNLDEAGAAFAYAASHFAKSVGENHPRTLTALNNLAYVQHERGELDAAEAAYKRALAGTLQTFGQDHSEYRGTLRNYAFLVWDMERYADAARLWAEVAGAFRRNEPGSETIVAMYEVYSAALRVMADPIPANIDAMTDAFEAQLELLPPNDPTVQSGLRQVVAALQKAGESDLADQFREQWGD